MSSPYSVVPLTPEHYEDVFALQRDLWRGDEAANRAYFHWKYDEGPAAEESVLTAVLHHDRLVGMRASVGFRWEGGSSRQRFIATNAADLLIAREHRGHELFPALSRASTEALLERGHAYSFGWSSGPRPLALASRLGWSEAGSLAEWSCVPATAMRRVSFSMSQLPLLGRFLGGPPPYEFEKPTNERDPASRLATLSHPRLRTRDGVLTLGVQARPADMADLIERLPYDGRIRPVRDDCWFAWRFDDPFACNRFIYCDDGGLQGYAVLQARRNRPRDHITVIDIEAASPQIWRRLIQFAIRCVSVDRLKIWTASFEDSERETLRKAGFNAVPISQNPALPRAVLITRRFEAANLLEPKLDGRLPTRISDWHVRGVNSDAT